MIKFMKKSSTWALSIITLILTFVPEATFEKCKWFPMVSDDINIVLVRVLTFIVVFVLSMTVNALFLNFQKSICIKGNNYSIQIVYGDLLEMATCKKVITFDECFTTIVGNSPSNIKPSSICGQYLTKNPIRDMQSLIENAQLKPARSRSKYQNKVRYDSGKLIPRDDDLLMAFAKLDEDGLGKFFSLDEFLECLSLLWKEIDKYYGQKDVYIPILGSGLTRIGDTALTQQELLDIMILSYRLSPHKIKTPCQLYIVCKKCNDFSLNRIGENIY